MLGLNVAYRDCFFFYFFLSFSSGQMRIVSYHTILGYFLAALTLGKDISGQTYLLLITKFLLFADAFELRDAPDIFYIADPHPLIYKYLILCLFSLF